MGYYDGDGSYVIEEPTATIYGIIDPRDEMVVYVGATEHYENRCKQHRGANAKTPIGLFMEELLAAGLEPTFIVIEVFTGFDFNQRERHWIAHYRPLAGDRFLNRNKRGRFDKPGKYERMLADARA